jgi:hypothetical protein
MVASTREAPRIDAWRAIGWAAGVVLRLAILYFAAEVVLNPGDPRFEGKNLAARNAVVLLLAFVLPAVQVARRRWERYPVWYDALYLTIFAADMLGNSLNLFDTYANFDLIPHFHGSGALAVVLAGAFGLGVGSAVAVANLVHALLEAQEWVGDWLFDSRNVRGVWDSLRDLAVGLAGSVAYPALWRWLRAPRAEPADAPQAGDTS